MPRKRRKSAFTDRALTGIELHGGSQKIVARWLLRMMIGDRAALHQLYGKDGILYDDAMAGFLHLPTEDGGHTTAIIIEKMKCELTKLIAPVNKRTVMQSNILLLNNRIALDTLQQNLLAFAVLVNHSEYLEQFWNELNIGSEYRLFHLLALAMNCNPSQIRCALDRKGNLVATGLLKTNIGDYDNFHIDPMEGLSQVLVRYHENESELLGNFLNSSKTTNLQPSDFSHLKDDLAIMQSILSYATNSGDIGVNLLFYGDPGTGKTELARLLAQSASATLFEVRSDNDKGEAIHSHARLESYHFSQQFLANDDHSMILFDEVEDIFPVRRYSFFGLFTTSGEHKGWINRMLEENRTPAIWISNQVDQIDPAFLRRFDYTLEVCTPPRSVRLNIARSALKGIAVSDLWMQSLVEHVHLTPADLAKAGKVARMLGDSDKQSTEDALTRMLGNTMRLNGHALNMARNSTTDYDTDCINTSLKIPELIEGLQRGGRGSLCFYGAPGTGKSALAAYIAHTIDKPLISKRASDILGKYVGQTEQNIAAMFAQAEREQGVLLLDEADSFLQDRRDAQRSWEVTQVNELLVQMEAFDGIFICSTNLMESLDQACLRRFDIKMHFGFLTTTQAEKMLHQECEENLTEKEAQQLVSLTNLTPGDFAAVKKRLKILGVSPNASIIIRELREELMVKGGGVRNRIGFG